MIVISLIDMFDEGGGGVGSGGGSRHGLIVSST